MIELMRGYDENNDHEDFTYFLLAQSLQKPLDRLGPVNTNCKNIYYGLDLTHEDFQRTIRAHCG